ncbi:zinc finger BED domain-containing 4-like isoform X1 [Solea senegalensis]|uniref:Zinc finger BED domain-containing 4-like isoform X1 n=1 Tax=Solea senegalensis TaxID=28829 RepID=A0AAV6Q6M1_SOLSE|nr:zinc finger BED domain-containing 4-like isoform X1 [Solea senegalensis]
MSRRRSVVWGFFKAVDSLSVRCVLCSDYQSKQVRGSTTNMLRHLRVKHPQEFAKTFRGRSTKSTRRIDRRAVNTDSEQSYYSVDVVLENEDSDNSIPLNESDINAAISDILEAAQGDAAEEDSAHAEVSDEPPVRHGRPRRSLIWRHYERLDGLDAAQCRICMKKLQCFEGSSTSNLRRHLSARHPEMFAGLVASGLKPPPSTAAVKTEVKQGSVDVVLENEDSDNSVPLNESDINAAEEDSAHAEVSDEPPVRHGRPRRSLIWRHYERLDGLDAAQCRICMKKLQCFEGSSTSNLRRHLSARHPEMFAGLVASGLKPPPSTAAVKTELKPGSGSFEGEKRVWRRERELIEALRRTQKEEARALEVQRDLLEKMRAADAREATAEREKIEALRKAQQEEAKELTLQREELQKEKAELRKKQEELEQEREELVLFSRGQECSTITSGL